MKAFMMWFLKHHYFAPDRRAAISWARDNCESLEEFWREANPDYVMELANIPGVLNDVTGAEYALYIVKHYGKCSPAELANWLRKNAKPNFEGVKMNKPQFKIACRLPGNESNGLTFEPNDEGRIDVAAYRTGYLGSIDPKALTALSEWAKTFIGKDEAEE